MEKRKSGAFLTALVFIPLIAGVTVSLMLENYIRGEDITVQENITRFNVIEETDISLDKTIIVGKPLLFRVIVENRENRKVTYKLKVILAGKKAYNETMVLDSGQTLNKTISFKSNVKSEGAYSKLEFLLYKNELFYKNVVYQILTGDRKIKNNTGNTSNTNGSNKTIVYIPDIDQYMVERVGNDILYNFDSGELLKLNITNISINFTNEIVEDKRIIENTILYSYITEDKFKLDINDSKMIIEPYNAIYFTNAAANNIIFLKDKYERSVPSRVNDLSLIINETRNKILDINWTLNIENNWSIVLSDINDREFKLKLIKDNRVIRDIIYNININNNIPIEYWEYLDEYKKHKLIQIDILKIDKKNITVNVTQYGGSKKISIGDRYKEFRVTNITEDSITMKNSIPIKIENGKVLYLMDNRMKIMV